MVLQSLALSMARQALRPGFRLWIQAKTTTGLFLKSISPILGSIPLRGVEDFLDPKIFSEVFNLPMSKAILDLGATIQHK